MIMGMGQIWDTNGCVSVYKKRKRDGECVRAFDREVRTHPLQREGDPVTPLIASVKQAEQDSNGNQLPDDPAYVDPRCHVRTQTRRTNVSGICDGKGLEDTPRDALDYATSQEHGEPRGEERDEDGPDHSNHGDDHRLAVAEALCDDAVDEESNDRPNLGSVTDNCLPVGGDDGVAVRVCLVAVSFLESWIRVETAHQVRIVAL